MSSKLTFTRGENTETLKGTQTISAAVSVEGSEEKTLKEVTIGIVSETSTVEPLEMTINPPVINAPAAGVRRFVDVKGVRQITAVPDVAGAAYIKVIPLSSTTFDVIVDPNTTAAARDAGYITVTSLTETGVAKLLPVKQAAFVAGVVSSDKFTIGLAGGTVQLVIKPEKPEIYYHKDARVQWNIHPHCDWLTFTDAEGKSIGGGFIDKAVSDEKEKDEDGDPVVTKASQLITINITAPATNAKRIGHPVLTIGRHKYALTVTQE